MPRIIVAECKQEVSSFNPAPSCYDDFRVSRGTQLFDAHRGIREEVGGAFSVFEATPDVTLIPTYSARAITSGGILSADGFSRLSQEFLAALEGAGKADAAYFLSLIHI